MKSNYQGAGIAFGAGLGAAVAVACGHMGIWLGTGIAIGTVIGGLIWRNPSGVVRKQHPNER